MPGTLVPVTKNFGPGRLVVRPRPVPRPRNPSLREQTWQGDYILNAGPRRRPRIAKRDTRRDRSASGAAIAGSGAVIGTAGLAGGGIPGVKSKRIWVDVKQASGRRTKARMAAQAYRGGEFGYRTNAHHTFKTFGLGGERGSDTRAGHFKHGIQAGKVTSEDKIIPHLKVARRLSNVALVGGGAAMAYGIRRAKGQPVTKADRRTMDRYSGTALGVGGTLAATSAGGARVLEHQGRRWSAAAARDLDAAHKIVPNMGGHVVNPYPDRVKNRRVPDVSPVRSNTRVQNDKGVLSGKSRAQAHAAGKLRGSAAQARYFAGTYGSVAHIARKVRNPALAVAGTGGGGLLLSRRKVNKAEVEKGVTGKLVKLRTQRTYRDKILADERARYARDVAAYRAHQASRATIAKGRRFAGYKESTVAIGRMAAKFPGVRAQILRETFTDPEIKAMPWHHKAFGRAGLVTGVTALPAATLGTGYAAGHHRGKRKVTKAYTPPAKVVRARALFDSLQSKYPQNKALVQRAGEVARRTGRTPAEHRNWVSEYSLRNNRPFRASPAAKKRGVDREKLYDEVYWRVDAHNFHRNPDAHPLGRTVLRKALLYERDRHISPIRAIGTTAGLGLAAWGLPRHKFLGPALAHGVKQASKHESAAALEALRLAEQAAGTLRDVTGRGERRLRTIQHLDSAIDRVPRAIRPEVATAAGLLLVGQSHPVRRTHYTPVMVGGGY